MIRHISGWTTLLLVIGLAPALHAACLVNDSDFNTAGGGCKDLNTGLVWSPDLRGFGLSSVGQSGSAVQLICDHHLNQNPANGGGFTDWRPPTTGEIEKALADGLNDHLNFFLNGS